MAKKPDKKPKKDKADPVEDAPYVMGDARYDPVAALRWTRGYWVPVVN